MRNIDKYKEELLLNAIACGVAVNKGTREIKPCHLTKCIECLFYDESDTVNCTVKSLEWLQAEYEEPKVDWSKVAVDTPIYVRNREDDYWEKRHFAKYEYGMVCACVNGTTSYTADDAQYYTLWTHAKLAEEKHEED